MLRRPPRRASPGTRRSTRSRTSRRCRIRRAWSTSSRPGWAACATCSTPTTTARRAASATTAAASSSSASGRGQNQYLASLFHADAPNDVAPTGFNLPEHARGPARQPARAGARRPRLSLGLSARRQRNVLCRHARVCRWRAGNFGSSRATGAAAPTRDRGRSPGAKGFLDLASTGAHKRSMVTRRYPGRCCRLPARGGRARPPASAGGTAPGGRAARAATGNKPSSRTHPEAGRTWPRVRITSVSCVPAAHCSAQPPPGLPARHAAAEGRRPEGGDGRWPSPRSPGARISRASPRLAAAPDQPGPGRDGAGERALGADHGAARAGRYTELVRPDHGLQPRAAPAAARR